ncbi:putative bifunctional diguanylate cyclase/phosphodiesterase [Legionella impletisoli]|uniref:GGDEF-domain containing protein n=1 Tax=Legionella impletisoli TaxID=343510 RepID=A0A917JWH7_9GAMM|nr:bifunctional diguanylate cyclase/phosphodiesterase [Legionella impletisoli]GGI88469.1 GGDEF-domain containing protein [Legionella impletisoli]
MGIKQQLVLRSTVLKGHVNKYTILGLSIAIGSIIFATCLVSYQLTGTISLSGIIEAQATNPAIWALDLTPFMFAYWGQSFCYQLASTAETIIEDQTREYVHKSDDLASKLQYESNHDHLTNLPNNRLLQKRLSQGIQQIKKGEELALILLTINQFRDINYSIGSYSANSLLVQFAEKLKSLLLEPYMLQAYMGMNMVARLQSAEFAILIPRLRKDHNLEHIIQNIIAETSTSFIIDGNPIDVKTTAGIAIYPHHGETDEDLIQHASLALLYAEKEQKNYALYEQGLDKNFKTRKVILKGIKSAIDSEEFEVLYKPVVALKTGNIIGSESVIKFNNDKYGLMTPEEIVSIVDGSGAVQGLTFFTLKKVISQLENWHKSGKKLFTRVYLYEAIDPDLPNILQQLLSEKNVPAEYLRLELTEQACLSDQTHTIPVLKQLSELGIKISISDFGSGYTSFIYLTNFPITEIKIDKSFTAAMLADDRKHSIVQAIVKLAGAMDLKVIADGVDNEAIKVELQKLGCTYGLGDYFSEPLEPDDFYKLFEKSEIKQPRVS